jgi:hypothetical protein
MPALLLLAGCTAPTSSQHAPDAPAAREPAAATPAPASAAAPVAQAPDTMETAPTPKSPDEIGRSCNTNSDCAVKDVGNCCGAYPMCVNKDTKTDPAAVRAQCEKEGMASICGFQEVSGCQCVKGQCENITNGATVM